LKAVDEGRVDSNLSNGRHDDQENENGKENENENENEIEYRKSQNKEGETETVDTNVSKGIISYKYVLLNFFSFCAEFILPKLNSFSFNSEINIQQKKTIK
jgi:hypothetical protein